MADIRDNLMRMLYDNEFSREVSPLGKLDFRAALSYEDTDKEMNHFAGWEGLFEDGAGTLATGKTAEERRRASQKARKEWRARKERQDKFMQERQAQESVEREEALQAELKSAVHYPHVGGQVDDDVREMFLPAQPVSKKDIRQSASIQIS